MGRPMISTIAVQSKKTRFKKIKKKKVKTVKKAKMKAKMMKKNQKNQKKAPRKWVIMRKTRIIQSPPKTKMRTILLESKKFQKKRTASSKRLILRTLRTKTFHTRTPLGYSMRASDPRSASNRCPPCACTISS